MPGLRIVTINTAKGDPPYRARVELIAAGLRRIDPHLVLLQESLRAADGRFDTAALLAERLDMESRFAPARFKIREIDDEPVECWSGMGLLSRLPIASHLPIDLPADPADGDRVAQAVTVKWNGRPLGLLNIHLSHLPGAAALRRRQLETALALAPFVSRDLPVIVGGDFNTAREEIDGLTGDLGDWRLTDAWTGPEDRAARATRPSSLPPEQGRCIDYLFVATRGGRPIASIPSASRVVMAEADANGVFPSDHRGVLATFDLPRRSE